MYANAWLGPQPGQPMAGDYPSGGPVGRVMGLVIAEEPDQVLLIGQGVGLDFCSPGDVVEVDSVEEGRFEAGRWVPGRALNGDERLFVLPADDIAAVRIRVLRRAGG